MPLLQVVGTCPRRLIIHREWRTSLHKATACEDVSGIPTEEFLRTYRDNRVDGRALTLESSPLDEPLIGLAADGFNRANELLFCLDAIVGDSTSRRRQH